MTSPSVPTPDSPTAGMANAVVRNRLLAVLVLFLVAVAGGLSAMALERLVWHREGPGHARFGPGLGPGRWHHPPRDRFTRELGLSAAQQARIDSLMQRQVRELRAVHQRVRPQVDSIVAQTRREIDSILTSEQREKARAFAPRFGGRIGERRGPGGDMGPLDDGPPPPPPPPDQESGSPPRPPH